MIAACVLGFALPAHAQSQAPGPEPDFNVSRWAKRYAAQPVPISRWMERKNGVHSGWFNGNGPMVAEHHFIHWGPLGIRTRMCDRAWSSKTAFKARWPELLTDAEGELLVDCFEVVQVWPGSPADGFLKPDDLLLAMDGQPFLSAPLVETSHPYLFKDTRSLELHAGLLLDQAEGRGTVSFKVLRRPGWRVRYETPKLHRDTSREAEIDVDVSAADRIRLQVVATEGDVGHGLANWLRPRLEGRGGMAVDLSEVHPIRAVTGWRRILRGASAEGKPVLHEGKPVAASIGTHVDSEIDFRVPSGFTRFKATLQLGDDRSAGIRGLIHTSQRIQATRPPARWRLGAEQAFPERRAPMQLDVSLEGCDRFRLQVDDGGNGAHDDGFDWLGVQLRRDGRALRLDRLAAIQEETGWGKITIDGPSGDWWVHANSTLEFAVPPGDWRLVGAGKPSGRGTVNARVMVHDPRKDLPAPIEALCREVRFDIPRIGAFAPGFPANCRKSANVVAITAAWLARQQLEDGSWPRLGGYTLNHYDTSWAALGLMATGDKRYDRRIRRAAEYIAFSGTHDFWAVPAGSALLFLSEYWLRYRDDRVLPAIEVWVRRTAGDMVCGDHTAGHGHTPGYHGPGLSIGGAAIAVGLAVAEKTPVELPEGLLDRMLAQAQALGPTGCLPYGRVADSQDFEPNLKVGGAYSGRHGPYLIASLLHGGPKLFTENCSSMYTRGPVGGIDKGHATQTLSVMWALPAVANVDTEAFHRHMEAFKWKMTMLRCFDGGYLQNSYCLELQTGEPHIDFAIRAACYMIALCAERRNLAITGAPQYRATRFVDVPPTGHRAATELRYFLTNWAVSEAALGERAPARLVRGVQSLRDLPRGRGLGERLVAFLESESRATAAALLALDLDDAARKHSLAEMILGIDHRISVEPVREENRPVPGRYRVQLTSVHSGGPMSGQVEFADPEGRFDQPVRFAIEAVPDTDWSHRPTREQKLDVQGPKDGSFDLTARLRYEVAGLEFDYVRPIHVGDREPWGTAEKHRTVVNDRRIWVPGTLIGHHAGWNLSFRLPSGVVVTAATQGHRVMVRGPARTEGNDWISPQTRTLLAGSECEFCFTSGWHPYECRIPEVRLIREHVPLLLPRSYSFDKAKCRGDPADLADTDRSTGIALEFQTSPKGKARENERAVVIDMRLDRPREVCALDVRLKPGQPTPRRLAQLRVHARVKGRWQAVYWGRLDGGGSYGADNAGLLTRVVPTTTKWVRVTILHPEWTAIELGVLRLYGPVSH